MSHDTFWTVGSSENKECWLVARSTTMTSFTSLFPAREYVETVYSA